jgi:hypothetical protein
MTFVSALRPELIVIAQSFSPFSARDGRQTCRPAMIFSVTKMQEEKNSTACFLKQNKFSFYFQNSFFCLGKKNVIIKKNQLNSSHTENHTRSTNLSA